MTVPYRERNGHSGDGYYAIPADALSRHRRTSSPLSFECVWLNGELVPIEDTSVHVLNPALYNGPGALEVIRCYLTERGPAIFRLEAHLQRFLRAARALGVSDLRYGLVDLRRAVHVTVQVNNLSTCTVRPILYFENDARPEDEGSRPTIAVVAGEWDEGERRRVGRDGVRAKVYSIAQLQSETALARGNFNGRLVSAVMARSMARRAGFDEAILMNAEGHVAACSADNLFLVHDGVAYTPAQAGSADDVARNTTMTLLQDLGYRVVEEPRLTRDHLYAADEAFFCGTTAETVPVREIDAHTLNGGQSGPVTRALQRLYVETTRGKGRRSRGWLEYVMLEPLF